MGRAICHSERRYATLNVGVAMQSVQIARDRATSINSPQSIHASRRRSPEILHTCTHSTSVHAPNSMGQSFIAACRPYSCRYSILATTIPTRLSDV